MYRNITKIVLSLALLAIIIPIAGCPRGRGGSYTSVDFGGGGFLPAFLSGGGYEEQFIDDSYYDYYDSGPIFDDSAFYDGGYYGGYDDFYYDDGWKTKRAGRTKR